MAAESNANRKAHLLQQIDQLLEWTNMQYIFIDVEITSLLNDIIIPRYLEIIKSINPETDPVRRQQYIDNMHGAREYLFKIRGHKEDTGLTEDMGYEQLRIDLTNLRQELLDNHDINRVKERLTILEGKYDRLNLQLNKFIKDIEKSMPGITIPRRKLSEHVQLKHKVKKFKFSTPNKKINIPANRTHHRGRNRNRSNVTHNARSRSAIRNSNRSRSPNRPRKGSIRIHEKASGPITFHINNIKNHLVPDPSNSSNSPKMITEPGMVHTGKEIKNMSRKGSINLSRIYGSTSIYRNKLRRWMGYADTRGMTGEAANAARKEARETAAMVRHMTEEAANIATEAAIAANAAAVEAQRIVSTVSHLSPIFQAIQPAADEASRAAQHAVELAHFAEESFSIGAAQGARDEAIRFSGIAVRALQEIRRTISSAPASAAAAAVSRRNST